MEPGTRALLAVAIGIIGLATISVVLSSRAQAATVIGAGGSAISQVLAAAESPITGGTG